MIKIEIAGFPVSIETANVKFGREILNRYKKFLSKKKPVLNIKIQNVYSKIRDSKGVEIKKHGNGFFIQYRSSSAIVDFRLKRVCIKMYQKNIYIFDSLLRIIYSLVLVNKKGFLIHSAGVLSGKNGYIFTGKSESGKSTIIKLIENTGSKEFIPMGDEILAVKKHKNIWRVFSTPFKGEIEHSFPNISGSVAKVFFIIKDKKTYCRQLDTKDALQQLLPNVIFFCKDKALMQDVFNVCCNFVQDISCYDLHFQKNNLFLKYL